MFILSPASSDLEFWSVIHENIWKFWIEGFQNIEFLGEISNIDQMTSFEQMYTRILNYVDNYCWQY